MKRIFLIRHGDPENPKKIVYGRLPGFPLSEKGRKEAREAGKYLKEAGARPEAIYSSPLERTRKTAKIVGSFFPKAKIELEEGVVEHGLGRWVGKKLSRLAKTPSWEVYLTRPEDLDVGEETLKEVQERAVASLKKIVAGVKKEAVVISHEHVIKMLLLYLEKKPINDLHKIVIPTGSVTTVTIDGNLSLLKEEFWRPNVQD